MRHHAKLISCIGIVSGLCSVAIANTAASEALQWQEPKTLAEGPAIRGPWRMNDSDFRYVDDPTVAMNRDGWTAVAWADQAEQDLFFQLYDPEGTAQHDEPVRLSRSPDTFSWLPRLVLDESDPPVIHALWQEIVFSGGSHGGEIHAARSTDGGESFSSPENLSQTEAGAGKGRQSRNEWQNGSLDLIRDDQGALHAAWTEYEGGLYYAHTTEDDTDFSEPVRVAGDSDQPARGPALTARADDILLVWASGETPDADLHFTRLQDGEPASPKTAVTSDDHLDAPGLATDSEGQTHLVFAASDAGPQGPHEIRHAELAPDDQAFGEATRISEPSPEEGFDRAHFPEIALDGQDRAVILWELYPQEWQRPLALGLAYRASGEDGFSDPMRVPGTGDFEAGVQGSLQGLFMRKLAVNSSGRIAVVNATFLPQEQSRITLLRGEFQDD